MNLQTNTNPDGTAVRRLAEQVQGLRDRTVAEVAQVVVGMEHITQQFLVALLAAGHVLLEGVPGVAKTTLSKTFAQILGIDYQRLQFTPDLLPSDVTGTFILDRKTGDFTLRRGPIFAQVLLADEVNRAPAKTQAALLEAMQERQVTVDGVSHVLPPVFTVFATQNPIEQEGTYPLPEAQLDRFMMKVLVTYPAEDDEVEILRVHQQGIRVEDLDRFGLRQVGGGGDLLAAQREVRERLIRDELLAYVARLVRATRSHLRVEVGASPRAGLMLLTAAKARAALRGRGHVLPDDVKGMTRPVLRHRIVLKPGAEVDGVTTDHVLDDILARTEVPR